MHVEIWSDIACPWCYVGKRRFEAALARFPHRDDVRVTWRSFELDPAAPAAYVEPATERLAAKYGITPEQAAAAHRQLTEVAAGDGIEMRFDLARGGSTFDAHRLLHLAAEHGRQDDVKERLMRARMSAGELVSDPAVLARIADEAGLPADETRELLDGDRFADAVRADERTAAELGIRAVPFFAIDRAIGGAGAQDVETMTALLERAWAAHGPLAVEAEGDACGVDGC